MITLIILNTIALAIYDYSDRNDLTDRNKMLGNIYIFFNIIFIFECLLKIIAYGFFLGPNSYLRNMWNIIDFLVVISSILELLPFNNGSTQSISSLRAFRAMRPLKSINTLPSMKKLILTLLVSIPNLLNVIALLSFFMLLFGILGLH